jgi:TolB-like protein/Tfp pilus assembly protein PilF
MALGNQRPALVPTPERTSKRLNSWKEIAVYLHTSVRTVQRWEQTEQLPVHRHEHSAGGTVHADSLELDQWFAERNRPPQSNPTDRAHTGRAPRPLRRWAIAAAVLCLFAAAIAVWWIPRNLTSSPPRSLAVLPFVHENGDAGSEYLAEGLPESITRDLSRLSGLQVKVLAHSVTRRANGRARDALEAGRLLGVEAVLTGRVTQRGDDLSVSVELIHVRDSSQIWGERFDRKLAAAAALQEEIAREIAARLRLRLSDAQQAGLRRASAVNPEAHRHYLRGRYHWNRRTEGGLQLAIDYFQQAIAADPAYALAHSGLAESYAVLSYYSPVPPAECAPKAIAAAHRALELDDTLSEAWNALAQVEADHYWQWDQAEQHFRRAIALNDNNADAHHWYSEFLAALRRFDEQQRELERAALLDPLSPIIATNQGHVFYFSRRFDLAADRYRRAILDHAQFPNPHRDLGRVLLATGSPAQAIEPLTRAQQLGGAHTDAGLLVIAHARAGQPAQARLLYDSLLARAQREYVTPYTLALASLGLGDHPRALDLLEQAAAERSMPMKWIGVEPLFDPIRAEPRFQALLRQMRLP